MSIFSEKQLAVINNPKSLKAVATVSREGVPHVAYKGSLHIEDDFLVFYDFIQSSQINKNLVNTIWFNGKVAINVFLEEEGEKYSYLITGKPVKCVTAGRKFEELYIQLQDKYGPEMDLSAIWYIEPENVRDETFKSRKIEEEEKYPYIKHIDRLLEK